ncbi:MAG: hypothetical protein ACR2OH_07755 [Microthrixaceae bacterium]
MKRLFWMGVGAAAGASGTVWAQRKVRGHIDELGAEQVVSAAGRGARTVGRTVRAALSEGRVGMAERELELKGRLLGTEATLDVRRSGVGPSAAISTRSRPVDVATMSKSGSGLRRRSR